MPTANERLFDDAIRHQIQLERYKNGTSAKLIRLLERTEADLIEQIAKRAGNGNWTDKRLEALLKDVRDILAQSRQQLTAALSDDMRALAKFEAGRAAKVVTAAVPVEIGLSVIAPAAATVYAAVFSRPFQGKLLRDWMGDLEDAQRRKLRDAIRIGVVEGETLDQIIRRVRGTRAQRYEDGIVAWSRRSTETVVRTAVNHTVTVAREQTYEANASLIKGIRWVSTLDGRTSAVCRARDGIVYVVGKGPRPPAHPNCRSSTVPVLKSWRELGIDANAIDAGTRASMNGQVPANETYDSWLRKQGAAFQDDVLGQKKARLFRAGLTLDRFVDRKGQEYTLRDLERLEPEIWRQAA